MIGFVSGQCICCTVRAALPPAGRNPGPVSPIVHGNGLIYYANAGKSIVIRSGPQFKLLAVNDLGDGNHPSPAVADGRMFLVGMKNVYCIRKE